MKLEPGKSYVRRDGMWVTLEKDYESFMAWDGISYRVYNQDGSHQLGNNTFDLLECVPNPNEALHGGCYRDYTRLSTENQKQAAEIERLKAEAICLRNIASKGNEFELECERLRARVEELESRKSGHLAESQRLLAERDTLKERVQELEADVSLCQEEIVIRSRCHVEVCKERDELRTQLEDSKALAVENYHWCQAAREQRDDYKQQLEAAQAKLAAYEQKKSTIDYAIAITLKAGYTLTIHCGTVKAVLEPIEATK